MNDYYNENIEGIEELYGIFDVATSAIASMTASEPFFAYRVSEMDVVGWMGGIKADAGLQQAMTKQAKSYGIQ